MLICLDAGHGGRDGGAVNGGRYEKNDNLKFANAVRTEFFKKGFSVIMTRTDDSYKSLQERTDFANAKKADLFISLHRNSFINNIANGVEIWVHHNASNATEDFAKGIKDELVKVGAQSDRGVKRGNFHVTRETKMPSCLLELGFISNTKDNELFDKLNSQYALALVNAVCSYLGISKDNQEIINKDDCKDGANCKLYRVQLGAFKDVDNAKRLHEELVQKGYNAIIV